MNPLGFAFYLVFRGIRGDQCFLGVGGGWVGDDFLGQIWVRAWSREVKTGVVVSPEVSFFEGEKSNLLVGPPRLCVPLIWV